MLKRGVPREQEVDNNAVSEDVAAELVEFLTQVADDRIARRLSRNDIALCFDARVTSVNNHEAVIGTVSIPNATGAATIYNVMGEQTSTVSVEYDNYVYTGVINGTGDVLFVGDWVKVCTYDNVKYYVLHLI